MNDTESDENDVVALNEKKRSVDERNEPQASHKYFYQVPRENNMVESDDLMVQVAPTSMQPGKDSARNIDDLMAMRGKRETKHEIRREIKHQIKHEIKKDTNPTFKRIYDFITNHDIMSPVSNELQNELTARASVAKKPKHSYMQKRDDTKSEMSNIFNGIQASKHHKLTRSDIRKLAKKAVMLATLKKLNEVKSKNDAKKSNILVKPKIVEKKNTVNKSKVGAKKTTKKKKKKILKKKIEKDKSELIADKKEMAKPTLSISGKDVKTEKDVDNIGETLSASLKESKPDKINDDIVAMLKDNKDIGTKTSEMSEDLSTSTKTKDVINLLSDESMDAQKNAKENLTTDTATSAITAKDTKVEAKNIKAEESFDDLFKTDKKASIETSDEDMNVEDALLEESTSENSKKSELPIAKITEQIKSLKYALGKSSPSKVPETFFPDLPVGIRMIAWKKLIEKKSKELSVLEASVAIPDDKPVMINIDIDQDKTEKDASPGSPITKDTEPDKKISEEKTSTHVHYLQKHIKGARALRKLIAKTLIGHCKTTGKRILKAFVAMDKALARAQAIATVIGHKFKIDADRIDALVGDKEDQVVETFLRDIFTKI